MRYINPRFTYLLTSPLSFGKSFMKIRSAVPENGCLIVLVDGKKQKKTKKTTAKHIRIRLLPEGGCVKNLKTLSFCYPQTFYAATAKVVFETSEDF